ncbi:hypothetical protein U1Q18_042608 [Sarracenia purpurea var. burkii]
MSLFYHEEPPNATKRCNFLTSTLKDAFANCRRRRGRLSLSNAREDDSECDLDDIHEVMISEIRIRAMEAKSRRKASFTGESFITPKTVLQQNHEDIGHEERDDDFFSVGSRFSRCSSARSTEATFVSVKTNFSRCSSLSGQLDHGDFWPFVVQDFRHGLDRQDLRRRSIIQELCQCEGWPFGLCRKALLLPPLPKSPSESWSWRKRYKSSHSTLMK